MKGRCTMKDSHEQFLEDLLKKRIIYINGEITPEMSRKFGMAIVWLNARDNKSEISLYIDSGGGSAMAGLDMYDMIKHSKAPVVGTVYRHASSMASVILQACALRLAMPHAEILIHSLRINEMSLDKLDEDPEKALSQARERQRGIDAIYHVRTGRSIKEVRNKLKENKAMSVKEALAFGLIDEII